MFNIKSWSHRNERQFKLGGGGGKQTEYLLVAALAVVIVGSLALTIWLGTGGGKSSALDTKLMYKCEKCGAEFEVDPKELQENLSPREQARERGSTTPAHIDCQKCGEKDSAVRMIQCPNPDCQKYYVSNTVGMTPMEMRGINRDDLPRDICPYCQTDRLQWLRDNHKKKSGK